jgi:hypothetical protein
VVEAALPLLYCTVTRLDYHPTTPSLLYRPTPLHDSTTVIYYTTALTWIWKSCPERHFSRPLCRGHAKPRMSQKQLSGRPVAEARPRSSSSWPKTARFAFSHVSPASRAYLVGSARTGMLRACYAGLAG